MATSIALCVFAVLALPPDADGRDLRYVPMNSQTILDMMKDRRASRDSKISNHHFSIRFSSNLKGCVIFPSYTNRKCANHFKELKWNVGEEYLESPRSDRVKGRQFRGFERVLVRGHGSDE